MNVLLLTHRLPYAPNRGDRIRAYHLLEELSRFATVSLFSLVHDDEEAALAATMPFAAAVATARIRRARNAFRGARDLFTDRPLTHALLSASDARATLDAFVRSQSPDVVLAYCSGMAPFALEPPLDAVPLVLDLVDVDSEKWRSLGARATGPLGWIYRREARTLAAFERAVAGRANAMLVINERERDALLEIAPEARVRIVRNGVDIAAFRPTAPPSVAPTVVFCGVMNYAPNVEGVEWFVDTIWPRVRASCPDAHFVIVGADPTRAVSAIGVRDPSVEITGRVGAVPPYLWRAAVSVAPLRVARGVQNKVLEALASGVPTVVTSAVRAGLPDGIERGCLVADTPEAFAGAIIDLLGRTPQARRSLAETSGVDRLLWSTQLNPMREILESAATAHHRSEQS